MQAILLNERGAEQKMVEMVERRGVLVAKLLDQTSAAGRARSSSSSSSSSSSGSSGSSSTGDERG